MGETQTQTDPLFGERMLQLLGFGHLIGHEVTYTDAQGNPKTIFGENFTEVCGEHATAPLQTLEMLSQQEPKHPSYDAMFNATRRMVAGRLGISLEEG